MLGRFLNFLLVYLHAGRVNLSCGGEVNVFSPDQYGITQDIYAYVSFLIVLLTYGMETAFFRRLNTHPEKSSSILSTVMISMLTSTITFLALGILLSQNIALWLNYPNNEEFIILFALIVSFDVLSSIPLALLRHQNKAGYFVLVNFVNIFINIGLNIFFLGYCMPAYQCPNPNWLVRTFYNPEWGVTYVFIANLVASGVKFLMLTPPLLKSKWKFDLHIWKSMMKYGFPIMLMLLAGVINEVLDRILIKQLLAPEHGEEQARAYVGIYGACYKIAIFMNLFIQAFRYAAEPFFFSHDKEKNSKKTFALVTKWFTITGCFIFLFILVFLNQLKFFIPNEEYHVGLKVVPILLLANLFFGLNYNLSVWFKLSEKTKYGALIAFVGAIITIVVNLILIKPLLYIGSAWATLACYASMFTLSYFLGKKHFPIPYPIKKMLAYIVGSLLLYAAWIFLEKQVMGDNLKLYASKFLILFLFLSVVYVSDLRSIIRKKV